MSYFLHRLWSVTSNLWNSETVACDLNKFAVSNHTAGFEIRCTGYYLSLIFEYDLDVLPNKKVSTAKDHGKNYMKDRPPLVRHLLRNCLFSNVAQNFIIMPSHFRRKVPVWYKIWFQHKGGNLQSEFGNQKGKGITLKNILSFTGKTWIDGFTEILQYSFKSLLESSESSI